MIKKLPSTWVSTNAYSVDDVVQYNGIRFVCIVAVPADANGNADPVDNPSWEFDGVIRITDYYSLQYAIQFELNTDQEEVNNSIPVYIQNVERKLSKLLRSPAQKISRNFTLTDGRSNESMFDIPDDLLAVVHLRHDTDSSGYSLETQGGIVVQKSDRTSYERLRQTYRSNGYATDYEFEFQYPLYVLTDSLFQITPRLEKRIEMEMTYYQQVPELGSTVDLVNDDYEPINEDGMTLEEWIEAGNPADTFVQAEEMVTQNLWTATTPHLLKAGALVEAYSYLNDESRLQGAMAMYNELLAATEIEFRKADASGAHAAVMGSPYALE